MIAVVFGEVVAAGDGEAAGLLTGAAAGAGEEDAAANPTTGASHSIPGRSSETNRDINGVRR
jgi:hypothetical protein